MGKERGCMASCILCHTEVKGNANPEKIITCGRCVQVLLTATRENKIAYREKLISEGKMEEARAIESFITPEEEVSDEPTKKFRRTLVRKRPLRKIWASYGKRPFRNDQLLDEGRFETR